MLYIVINVFIGGPLENQLVEGQPSLKELNMKKYNIKYKYMKWYDALRFLALNFSRINTRGRIGLSFDGLPSVRRNLNGSPACPRQMSQ